MHKRIGALCITFVLLGPQAAAQTIPGVPKIELNSPAEGLPDPPDPPFFAPLDLTPPPDAGAPHPRLLFDADDLPEIKARIADPSSVPGRAYKSLLARADDIQVTDPVLDRPGRRFGRQDLADLALAYLLSDDPHYLAKAKEFLVTFVATAPNYGAVETFDATEYYNTRAHILAGLALAWDWLYNDLTENERALLLSALVTLGSEHFTHSLSAWWGTVSTGSNFTGNNGAAVGMAGLAAWGHVPATPLWFARGRQLVLSYFQEGFDDTGAGYEGVLYGNYGLRIPTYFSAAVERAGLPNPLHHAKIRLQPRWVAYEVLPGGGALNPLNDARYRELNPTHMLWASSNGADPYLAGWIWRNVADRIAGGGGVAEWVAAILWFQEPDPDFDPENLLPLSAGFLGRGLVHARSGWDAGDLMTSFESRHNDWGEGVHQNQDANSFTLYSHGARFAVDSGYANYIEKLVAGDFEGARSSETEAHNYIEADGRSQDFHGKGRLRWFSSGAEIDVAAGDARLGYLVAQPEAADRWFLHLRDRDGGPGYLVITDRFRQGNGDHAHRSYLHTEPGNTIDVGPSVSADELRATVHAPNGAELAVTVKAAHPIAASTDFFTADYPEIGRHQRLVVGSDGAEHATLTTFVPAADDAVHGSTVTATGGVAVRHGADVVLYRTAPDAASAGDISSDGVVAVRRGGSAFALIEGNTMHDHDRLLADVEGGAATVIASTHEVVVDGSRIDGFKVWGPGVHTVRSNGEPIAFARCNGYVVSPPSC